MDFIDINCGCPIDVAVRKGFGSGLMRKPNKMCRVVQGAVNELDVVRRTFRVPVPELTVKMRTGFLDGKRNADMIVKKFQSFEKLSHVSIHGRTRGKILTTCRFGVRKILCFDSRLDSTSRSDTL